MNRVWGPKSPAPELAPQGPAPTTWTRIVLWAGMTVVLAAAAVLSFFGLRDLGVAVRIDRDLAWLLPIAIDAGAAVSCACWLSRWVVPDARRFARWLTWGLLALTVGGNAAQLGMHANGIVPPWWVAVLVGGIPPAVVGGVVHLAVLVGRTVDRTGDGVDTTTRTDTSTDSHTTSREDEPPTEEPDEDDELTVKARELVAAGAGRPTLSKELSISDYRAGQLLKTLRPNGQKAQS